MILCPSSGVDLRLLEVLGKGESLSMVVDEEAPAISGGSRVAVEIDVDTTHGGEEDVISEMEIVYKLDSWESVKRSSPSKFQIQHVFERNANSRSPSKNYPTEKRLGIAESRTTHTVDNDGRVDSLATHVLLGIDVLELGDA
ncbi:hypothetical protein Tco_0189859 [Tanacetum coccineum]